MQGGDGTTKNTDLKTKISGNTRRHWIKYRCCLESDLTGKQRMKLITQFVMRDFGHDYLLIFILGKSFTTHTTRGDKQRLREYVAVKRPRHGYRGRDRLVNLLYKTDLSVDFIDDRTFPFIEPKLILLEQIIAFSINRDNQRAEFTNAIHPQGFRHT